MSTEPKIPYGQEKSLTVQTDTITYRGKLTYEGKGLHLKTKTMELRDAIVEVPNGIFSASADESMKLIRTYMEAKGLRVKAKDLDTEALKFCAGLEGLLIEAERFKDKPTITNKHKESTWKKEHTTHDWQEGKRSEFLSEGMVVIKADDYIRMIAPVIDGKKGTIIHSPDTVIHGIFLQDKSQTTVKKKDWKGSSKTNVYASQNDKPLKAELNKSGGDVTFSGKAKINATMGAKTIYDLTDEGVELFFVLGRQGNYENRGFHTLLTQGNEGYQKTSEKILKTDITQVETIERPSSKGSIKFDTVQWNKDKTVIKGTLEEKIYKTKSWVTAWEEETISKPLLITIGVVAAVAAGGVGADALLKALTVASGTTTSAMVSAGLATLAGTASTTFAASKGDFEKTFKSLIADQTVKNTAVSVATAGLTSHLIEALKLKIDSTTLSGQLQKNGIRGVVGTGLNMAIKGEELHKALEQGVKETAVGTLAGYASSKIALKYGLTDKTSDYMIHKGLHGVVGALSGLALGNSKEAVIAGGLGAMSAEIAFDAMVSKEDIEKKTLELARTARNKEDFDKKLLVSFQRQRDIAKIIGATSGAFFGQEPSIAQQTATTAIENNAGVAVGAIARLALNRIIAEGGRYIGRELLHEINKANLNESQKETLQKEERKGGGKGPELEPEDPKEEKKARNKPPQEAKEAEGRSHTIVEKPGKEGQYTTHYGDGTWKQYRGSGKDHGVIPRPNIKETTKNITPDGKIFIDKGRVRPPRIDEIPGVDK